jgi:excisionase family DNA binding protein
MANQVTTKREQGTTFAEESELLSLRKDDGFEPLLDVSEAARLLRMHPRTLRAKARERIIPAIQIGRRWRFRASTLNDWLEKLAS